MPPGCFIIIFIFFAWKTRTIADSALRKRLRMFSLIGAAGLYLLSIRPVQQMLAGGLENIYPVVQESQIKKTNTIIILSAGIVEGVPVSFSPLPVSPGPLAIIRLSEGIRLYRRIKADERGCMIILTGGCIYGNRNAASSVSREWLVSMGIPSSDIRLETSARTTFEEARFALPIVRSINPEALFLVTHASHMRRAMASFRKFGMSVIPAPCGFSNSGKWGVFSYLPEAGTLQENRLLLWEYLGNVFYWFKRP